MRLIMLAAAAAFIFTGCATAPNPAEVCTAEWIAPRAESAVKKIEKDTDRVIKSLNKSAGSYADGKTPGPLEIFQLTRSIDRLTKELKSGEGIKNLRVLRDTCNDPDIISDSLSSFMKDKGLPEGLIDFIQSLDAYQRLLESEAISKPS